MDIDRIDPALRPALARLPTLDLENPLRRRLIVLGARLQPGARVRGVARRIVRAGRLRLRVYTPEHPSGAGLVWIHGGGLVLGSARGDDRFCGETARATGVTIVSVDYRLAPRHPYPAALDDVHTAALWMRRSAAALGIEPGRLAVGGQSAGGGLAACLVQRLHDEGVPVAAQWLFCPMLDDRTAADRSLDAAAHPVWSNRSNLVGWSAYLGRAPGGAAAPPYAVAARRADLAGLPPAWLYVSDIELFGPEVRRYAERLRAAEVPTVLETVRGAPHGFEAWAADTAPARGLLRAAREWLGAQLS